MKKSTFIKLIDLIAFLSLLFLISTGGLLKYLLPAKSGHSHLWQLTRHEWGDLHFYISVLFLLLMCVHLFLHYKFISQAIKGRAPREQSYRIIVGLTSAIVLLILLVAPYFSPIVHIENSHAGKGKFQQQLQHSTSVNTEKLNHDQ